jgi:K+-transporting ATPase ATPase C chain
MKHFMPALRMLLFMTFLTGVAYPLVVTALGQMLFYQQSSGSLLRSGDVVLGSSLVAQNFEAPRYFWPRPSGVGFNPLPSGGTNLGPTSADLKKAVDERRAKLKIAHPDKGEPPQDLLFASGSGLDPEISLEAAHYQLNRVAKVRGMTTQQVSELVERMSEGRQWGFLGEPRVHVLKLNVALDEAQGLKISPVYVSPPPPPPPPSAPPAGSTTQ